MVAVGAILARQLPDSNKCQERLPDEVAAGGSGRGVSASVSELLDTFCNGCIIGATIEY